MPNKLLFITLCLSALYAWFYMYNNYGKPKAYIEFDDDDRQEVIVVNKVPRGTFWGEDWHDIGLSRNGEEPIEYIWRAFEIDPSNGAILNAEIGDRGTVCLHRWAKPNNIKLPLPNAENPSVIGVVGEVYWIKNDYDQQELIIVNKIPRGVFAGEELSPELRNIGWYDIGLSRNGEEPIEYIWRAGQEPYNYFIMLAEIGDRGTIHLDELAKRRKEKLPRPNAENPPIIGVLGEVYWEKYNDDNDRQEVIVVSKTESTPYGKAIPRSGFFGTGGYVLGLSRNGEDPVEYLWYAGYAQYGDAVRNTEIGDKGIVGLQWWAKKYYYMRLPQPNAENPPIIGFLGEVYWKKQE